MKGQSRLCLDCLLWQGVVESGGDSLTDKKLSKHLSIRTSGHNAYAYMSIIRIKNILLCPEEAIKL